MHACRTTSSGVNVPGSAHMSHSMALLNTEAAEAGEKRP